MDTQPNTLDDLLTLQEAAKKARVSDVTARRLIATSWSGFSFKIGRRHKVGAVQLDAWIKTEMQKAQAARA